MKPSSRYAAVALIVGVLSGGLAEAQVIGGGSTLSEYLHDEMLTSLPLPGFQPYGAVGSAEGKKAFFSNVVLPTYAPGSTVDYAASESLVTSFELAAYNDPSNSVGVAPFGPLIQVPVALTSVTVPYSLPGAVSVDLTSTQLVQVFAGAITNWNQLTINGVPGPNLSIKVVFREDRSGTTEVFVRHLNAVEPVLVPTVNNDFATALGYNPGTLPPNFVGVVGSEAVVEAVHSTVGSIGYVGPDHVAFDDPGQVARVNGWLPSEVNAQAFIGSVSIPITPAERANPQLWPIVNPAPVAGYPIAASTNLIFSQCYLSAADNARMRALFNSLYTGQFDSVIAAHSMMPLSQTWQHAVHQAFYNQSDIQELAIGHPAECAGRGRPL